MSKYFRGVCVFNINEASCQTNGEITSGMNLSVCRKLEMSSLIPKLSTSNRHSGPALYFFFRQKPDIAVRLSAALRFLVFMHNDSLGP